MCPELPETHTVEVTVPSDTQTRAISESSVRAILARERTRFIQRNPRSQTLSEEGAKNWLRGVPTPWMEWGTPFPLFIARASGAEMVDVDGNEYVDFCLADTGALFGHSPPVVLDAIQHDGMNGFTTGMPSPEALAVGRLLEDRFGLPCWQVTSTASDANRSVIRWCRAITGRTKILVFSHCNHGAVDETFVRVAGGQTQTVVSSIGEPRDLAVLTKVVEFNDVAGLESALAPGDIACVLAEPYMTNVGMVLADDGFHSKLRAICRRTGTLLILDETHCLSSGPGGYCGEHGLEPDGLVFGKPIAGGFPAGAYGFSAEMVERIRAYLAERATGHSGIGTSFSGSRMQLVLMHAVLETFCTREAFAPMLVHAEMLERGIADVIRKHSIPWHVVRVGVRVEFLCCPDRPRNGGQASRAIHQPIDQAVHDFLLNRGLIITPFDNMMLICPATTATHIERLIEGLDRCVAELIG